MLVQYFLIIAIMMSPGLLIGGLNAVIDQRIREQIFGKKYLRACSVSSYMNLFRYILRNL